METSYFCALTYLDKSRAILAFGTGQKWSDNYALFVNSSERIIKFTEFEMRILIPNSVRTFNKYLQRYENPEFDQTVNFAYPLIVSKEVIVCPGESLIFKFTPASLWTKSKLELSKAKQVLTLS